MKHILKFITLFLVVFNSFAVAEKTPKTLKEAGLFTNEHTPAFALLVRKNGKTVFKDVQGCARFSEDRKSCDLKATNNTPMGIASLTKHFVVAAILMLEEEGKLSTKDEFIKYLDFGEKFKGITIDHLIFHTSGMPDSLGFIEDRIFDDTPFTKTISQNDMMEDIKNYNLNPKGVEFAYSNSGYVLLGAIIEKVSGKKYEVFIKERIFEKLKMKDTFFASSFPNKKDYALPYTVWPMYEKGNWVDHLILGAEAGIWISLNDYEKWIIAWEKGKIFKKSETMAKFLSKGKLDDGTDIGYDLAPYTYKENYGYGMAHGKIQINDITYKYIAHEGVMPGIGSFFINLKDEKTKDDIWVMYTNNNSVYPKPSALLRKVKVL